MRTLKEELVSKGFASAGKPESSFTGQEIQRNHDMEIAEIKQMVPRGGNHLRYPLYREEKSMNRSQTAPPTCQIIMHHMLGRWVSLRNVREELKKKQPDLNDQNVRYRVSYYCSMLHRMMPEFVKKRPGNGNEMHYTIERENTPEQLKEMCRIFVERRTPWVRDERASRKKLGPKTVPSKKVFVPEGESTSPKIEDPVIKTIQKTVMDNIAAEVAKAITGILGIKVEVSGQIEIVFRIETK